MPKPTKGPRLGGSSSHQKALLANLATSLFEHGRIKTTEPKARALRPYAEKLITHAKKGTLHNRREVMKKIRDKDVVHALFAEIGPFFADRNGGYTRIIKVEARKGDNAPMAVIELVREKTVTSEADRARRVKASKKAPAAAAAAPQAAVEPEEAVGPTAEEVAEPPTRLPRRGYRARPPRLSPPIRPPTSPKGPPRISEDVRLRLDIAYDGTAFAGWAAQAGQRTVAGVLDEALTTVFRTPVRLRAAGRTDAGVHATGQVAHVDVPLAALPNAYPRSPRDGDRNSCRWCVASAGFCPTMSGFSVSPVPQRVSTRDFRRCGVITCTGCRPRPTVSSRSRRAMSLPGRGPWTWRRWPPHPETCWGCTILRRSAVIATMPPPSATYSGWSGRGTAI